MIIDVYTYVHNEEIMLPYFFRHYGQFSRKITVFDNESNDRTTKIAKEAGAEVIPISTGGKHRVETLQKVMNEEYKKSLGSADWVICAEGDEFFWHEDLPGLLGRYKEEGVTLPKTRGFDMVSDSAPYGEGQIWGEIKNGFPNTMYDKRGIFCPSIDINFGYGGHTCSPKGNVVESKSAEILLLHYRFLGKEYFSSRYQVRRQRISNEDASRGLGAACLRDHEVRYQEILLRERANIVQVIPR